MNATDPLERLRAANPVPDPAPDEDAADALLARLLATPRRAPRRALRRRLVSRLAVPAAVAAVAAAVAVLVVAPAGGGRLIERAYAAALPGGDVIHEVVEAEWRTEGGDGPEGGERIEAWYRPADGRARRHVVGDEGRYDVLVAADDTATVRSPDTGGRWRKDRSPAFVARNRTDFLHEFRKAYEAGQLKELGPREFGGRDTVAYEVRNPRGIDSLVWYVDAERAVPIASLETLSYREKAGGPLRTQFLIRRLVEHERLPPTVEHLRLVETPPGR